MWSFGEDADAEADDTGRVEEDGGVDHITEVSDTEEVDEDVGDEDDS